MDRRLGRRCLTAGGCGANMSGANALPHVHGFGVVGSDAVKVELVTATGSAYRPGSPNSPLPCRFDGGSPTTRAGLSPQWWRPTRRARPGPAQAARRASTAGPGVTGAVRFLPPQPPRHPAGRQWPGATRASNPGPMTSERAWRRHRLCPRDAALCDQPCHPAWGLWQDAFSVAMLRHFLRHGDRTTSTTRRCAAVGPSAPAVDRCVHGPQHGPTGAHPRSGRRQMPGSDCTSVQ